MKNELLTQIALGWKFKSLEEFLRTSEIKLDDIGDLLSDEGYENLVLEYQNNKVIKLLKPRLTTKILKPLNMGDDLALLKKIFAPEYIAEGEVRYNKIDPGIELTLQEKFDDFRPLERKDLANPRIRKQYEYIVQKIDLLYAKHNLALDVVGFKGFIEPLKSKIRKLFYPSQKDLRYSLSNIVVCSDNQLKIIDYRLIPTKISMIKSLRYLIIVSYGKFEHIWHKVFLYYFGK